MIRVLLIEDDAEMVKLIGDYLQNYGYVVTAVSDPASEFGAFEKSLNDYDVVIVDLMLPGIDGFDLCKRIRSHSQIPIIISSARGDIGNKIYGYELGADDYLAKPYEPRELILRIEAILRRSQKSSPKQQVADFEIDTASREVSQEGYPIDFTPVEYEIFLYLTQNPQKVISREQIAQATSLDYDTKDRTVDMHISNIRYKIGDDAKHPKYIKSVWGIGYKFIG